VLFNYHIGRFVLGSLCVGDLVRMGLNGVRVFSLHHGHHSNPSAPKFQHTSNQEQYDQCGNSTVQSQAPDVGYINVRNMLEYIRSEIKWQVTSSWSFILQLLQ